MVPSNSDPKAKCNKNYRTLLLIFIIYGFLVRNSSGQINYNYNYNSPLNTNPGGVGITQNPQTYARNFDSSNPDRNFYNQGRNYQDYGRNPPDEEHRASNDHNRHNQDDYGQNPRSYNLNYGYNNKNYPSNSKTVPDNENYGISRRDPYDYNRNPNDFNNFNNYNVDNSPQNTKENSQTTTQATVDHLNPIDPYESISDTAHIPSSDLFPEHRGFDNNDQGHGQNEDFTGIEGSKSAGVTEHSGGFLTRDRIVFEKTKSPYLLKNDLIVEEKAELVIEPGVEIRVEPQIGVTVRGVLTAAGNEQERITFTAAKEPKETDILPPDVRLVDGPSILAGRLQIKYNGAWRSVCTNSRNWTMADMSIACRQLGFQGGSFFMWHDRQMPLRSRLLFEEPKCRGSESTLFECEWSERQLGSGVCDYHPDLGIQCLPRHENPSSYWRGIRFENSKSEKILTLQNTLYVPTSISKLEYVEIKFAGNGRNHNTTSAIEVIGVPPVMRNIEITKSAYNGMNITKAEAPIRIHDCRVYENRGHGIFINSSFGLALINGCNISENGADGIHYVHNEERPDENIDKSDISDFCTLATSSMQTFPIQGFMDQSIFTNKQKQCSKVFTTRYGHKITLHFLRAQIDRNNTASIEVYDGSSTSHRLLTSFSIRNNTRPQSVTSISNQIYLKFTADAYLNMFLYMRLTSGLDKGYDLNVTKCDIYENQGRGIAFDNLRSQLHIHDSSISKNGYTAGVHVTSGVGDVNVTSSRISFNEGDGINVTYTGGARNISRSSISSNQGYGVAIWLNQTKETEFIVVNQTTVVQYSNFVRNLDIGVLHGNFCGLSYVNITGNTFEENLNDALEVLSCWLASNVSTSLQIGHNMFLKNQKIAIKIKPALNLDGYIEFNNFMEGVFGQLLIKNTPLEEFNFLKTNLHVQNNYFRKNTGLFVCNMALSPYSETQHLLFTKNFVQDNYITEPFLPEDGSVSKLIPRSRVAAPLVVGSYNVKIYRNIIENPRSKYEIGSHLEDQSKVINCSFNWLGFSDDEKIFHRLFHRYDRYNLARITFVPYLLHNTNYMTKRISSHELYIPRFVSPNSNIIGGEIEGEEVLHSGEYVVERDISVRPGGKLTLEPGVTIKFPPGIGMMIGGSLEARGRDPDSIRFTLKEEIMHPPENETTYDVDTEFSAETEIIEVESKIPIRLLGGKEAIEGRLQVKINNEWGTVCNYGWSIIDAALVCHQLGLVLNPDDWFLEPNEIPDAGTSEKLILTNVQCDEFDTDITKCKAEKLGDFEHSCGHENDVGVRCYDTSWAGVRFSVLSKRADLQFITIEKAGLLDFATNSFKPALQIDFARHNFDSIKVKDNYHDGLGVMYSDIYGEENVNLVKNSEFSNNKGAGISFKQLGLKVQGSIIDSNYFGIQHNPALTGLQQRELAGWFNTIDEELDAKYTQSFWIPHELDTNVVEMTHGKTWYLVTSPVAGDNIKRSYKFYCQPGYVVGIQLLNPIQNRSTETIWIHDALNYNNMSAVWSANRDLTVFPTTSSSHGIVIDYNSGSNSLGGAVLVLSYISAPVQNVYNRIVKGPIPTLTVLSTKIRGNNYGVHTSYYNRYLNELGDHFLRKANETMKFLNCEISHNKEEAFFTHSPHWDLHKSNISEITFMINNSLITDNGKGIYQFSRDMRASNNLFHYVLQDDTIERNRGDGLDISLPYVWQYNENFTHSIYMDNNTWRNNQKFGITIDGHFAIVNITNSQFLENKCKDSLIAIKGMEKKLKVMNNQIKNNNGRHMVEFSSDSQSEILGEVPARFVYNELKNNKFLSLTRGFGTIQLSNTPTSVIIFKGIQKVRINRNLFAQNGQDYQLIAGIKTAKLRNDLDIRENWWGTINEKDIQKQIFDFDDWNNHAVAIYQPYLTEDDTRGSHSMGFSTSEEDIPENLGGRLNRDLVVYPRDKPYVITADITVMPKTTLTISPGVVMEFAPNIGILVLGTLNALGYKGGEITMRPLSNDQNQLSDYKSVEKRDLHQVNQVRFKQLEQYHLISDSIRLCKGRDCLGDKENVSEGFLEYFNKTTLQWIPMCDPRFTERNAQVVCRELGFDSLSAFFDHDIRIEFHSNSLSRIWSWPEPLQCKGTESRYDDCPIRLNGQQYGHRHECKWSSKFVFVHCGNKASNQDRAYWGGIRFAHPDFESHMFEQRYHDVHSHNEVHYEESRLDFVNIIGAGILHNEKSPAIQTIVKSPKINYVKVNDSASHGINIISPSNTMNLVNNVINNSLGIGINILSLTGEGREADESSFTPLKGINIPYNLFSLIDICDTSKEIRIEERVLLYYKYDNHPVNCVKIFKSAYSVKPIGFRLLQFNLFNSTSKYGIPDFITLYDGDIYNVTSKVITKITMETKDDKRMFKSKESSMSIKLFANGASSMHGFIAEVVTLPISAIGFNRDVQHNITNSVIANNREGGLVYVSAGEVNPIVTIDKNQFRSNCEKLYGNFTTCKAAVDVDVQNTQTLLFRNNLIDSNQGGLAVKADSRGSATSLKGYIHNNLFVNNTNLPALYVEGRQSSPYQLVFIYRNYFTRNFARYENNIVLKQVVSNFSLNYIQRNIGLQNLEVSGFDKVRLPIYQTTYHNAFYNNYAINRDSRSTIVAGTAGQHYVDNIFFNPDNDYEMITVNRSLFNFNSTLEVWKTKIDATYNYWGVNTSIAVAGRIRDQYDDPRLLEVNYQHYYRNNETILTGLKCPPGWDLVGDTCYIYIGAPMTFHEARAFCAADNASMPYIIGNLNYVTLYDFLRKQQQWYLYSDKVWVQHIDRINTCTAFVYQTTEADDCGTRNPFICEIDPKVFIDPLVWRGDIVTIAVIGAVVLAFLLLALVIICWWSKSKYRHAQRLERRNSIRQSLRSLRSVGSTTGFSEFGYGRKPGLSTRSTDTLTKASDYKKMLSNGSIDSMEKSAYNSSIEDNQSYDIYETNPQNPSSFSYNTTIEYHKPNFLPTSSQQHPHYAQPNFSLSFKNEGFKDNSTFASNSRAPSIQETTISDDSPPATSKKPTHNLPHSGQSQASYPPSDYYTTDTLPLNRESNSTLNTFYQGRTSPSTIASIGRASGRSAARNGFLAELKSRIPNEQKYLQHSPVPPPIVPVAVPQPAPPPTEFYYDRSHELARPKSTEYVDPLVLSGNITGLPTAKTRSKSEALLETNFDYFEPEEQTMLQPMGEHTRSKSQPLETAM